jgi:hypothetical protein
MSITVANASPLIALARIDQFSLLSRWEGEQTSLPLEEIEGGLISLTS